MPAPDMITWFFVYRLACTSLLLYNNTGYGIPAAERSASQYCECNSNQRELQPGKQKM